MASNRNTTLPLNPPSYEELYHPDAPRSNSYNLDSSSSTTSSNANIPIPTASGTTNDLDESTNSSNTSSGKVCRQVIDYDDRKLDIYISNPDSPARPYINIIYRKVGPDWKALARQLNIDNTDINKIARSYAYDIDEQCANMLDQFCKSKRSGSTKLALVKALFSSGLRSVAEIILDVAAEIGPANIALDNATHQHTSNILKDDSMRNECFIAIADEINWDQLDKLGLKLTLQSNVVYDIISTNENTFSKCFRLLDLWYQKFASNAELEYLLTVVKECGCEAIYEKLNEIFISKP